jgi:hypothetical protein
MWKKINMLLESCIFVGKSNAEFLHPERQEKQNVSDFAEYFKKQWAELWKSYENFGGSMEPIPPMSGVLCIDDATADELIYINDLMEDDQNKFSKKIHKDLDKYYQESRKICGNFLKKHCSLEPETFSLTQVFIYSYIMLKEAIRLKNRSFIFVDNNSLFIPGCIEKEKKFFENFNQNLDALYLKKTAS